MTNSSLYLTLVEVTKSFLTPSKLLLILDRIFFHPASPSKFAMMTIQLYLTMMEVTMSFLTLSKLAPTSAHNQIHLDLRPCLFLGAMNNGHFG